MSASMSTERTFEELFGRPARASASASGRVNLMGDHTDYNLGFVFPAPIPQTLRVELDPSDGDAVRVWSRETGSPIEAFRLGEERAGRGWIDRAQAITWTLRRSGRRFGGFDARVVSAIPPGAGLASSAAFSVAFLSALRRAFSLDLDDGDVADLARRAEVEFIGAPVGAMDPLAVLLGRPDEAIFLDTRSLAWERVAIPRGAEIVVVHSGIVHSNDAEGYATRRDECERAASALGVAALRDASPADLPRIDLLDPPLDGRARHVVTENERVLAAVAAFRDERLDDAGRLFFQSHRSLSIDFAVSTPEIDALVDLARAEPDVYGARITGGGFGGAVVLLAARGRGARAGRSIVARYGALTGRRGAVLVPSYGTAS